MSELKKILDSFNNGTKALMEYIEVDDIKSVRTLLDAGVNVRGRKNCWSPLHQAVKNSNNDLAVLLLQYGASVNSIDYAGKTPLRWAIKKKNVEMCKILICAGSDVNRDCIPNGSILEFVSSPINTAKDEERAYIIIKELHKAGLNSSGVDVDHTLRFFSFNEKYKSELAELLTFTSVRSPKCLADIVCKRIRDILWSSHTDGNLKTLTRKLHVPSMVMDQIKTVI